MGLNLYLRYAGKVTGPFTTDVIAEMKAQGKIGRMHQVSDDRVTWTSIRQDTMPVPKAENSMNNDLYALKVAPKSDPRTSPKLEQPALKSATRQSTFHGPVSVQTLKVKVPTTFASETSVTSTQRSASPRWWWRPGLLGVAFLVLAIAAGGVLIYQHLSQRAAYRADITLVVGSVDQAQDLIDSGNYVGAKKVLDQAYSIGRKHLDLAPYMQQIQQLLASPEITWGAKGFVKVDDQWLPGDTAKALVKARKRDDPAIAVLEVQARRAKAEQKYQQGEQDCLAALKIISAEPVQPHPKSAELRDLEIQIHNASVTQEMTAKGFVLYQNQWVTPDQKFRLQQMAKGLVNFENQWITPGQRGQILAARAAEQQRKNELAAAQERQRVQAAADERARQQKAAAQALAEQKRLEGLKETAYDMSQEFLKDTLKAPASAQFQPYSSQLVTVVLTNDGWFIVKAVVDAQNTYGAMLRKTYYSKLKPVGGDKWHSESTFLDEDDN